MNRLSSSPAERGTLRVLLVDDHPDDRALAVAVLRARVPGLRVSEAADAAAFAEAVGRGGFDAVVVEGRLAWSDGLALVAVVRRLHAPVPVVLWTGDTDPDVVSRALSLGVAGFVPKTSGGYLRLPEVLAELLAVSAPTLEPDAGPRRLPEAPEPDAELFAHAASHDLQEPVQHVVRFARRLAARLPEDGGGDARRDLEHLVASAERLQGMLDGLLEVSRLTRRDHPFVAVELGPVVDEATANLRQSVEETGGEVVHGPLPTVVADRPQMVQLFQNLIGNALKFRGEAPPRIHVSAREEQGRWIVAVRDNGIGIDATDQERIFRLFHRLHPDSRYPGRGVGLALCRRIAEHHGGGLEVESRPGEGATFSVSLPRQEAGAGLARPRSLETGGA